MLLRQEFKTGEGARKRAAFENAHSPGNKYWFRPVRCLDGVVDATDFDPAKFTRYTWRLERIKR
jgi:hypothetical protein